MTQHAQTGSCAAALSSKRARAQGTQVVVLQSSSMLSWHLRYQYARIPVHTFAAELRCHKLIDLIKQCTTQQESDRAPKDDTRNSAASRRSGVADHLAFKTTSRLSARPQTTSVSSNKKHAAAFDAIRRIWAPMDLH